MAEHRNIALSFFCSAWCGASTTEQEVGASIPLETGRVGEDNRPQQNTEEPLSLSLSLSLSLLSLPLLSLPLLSALLVLSTKRKRERKMTYSGLYAVIGIPVIFALGFAGVLLPTLVSHFFPKFQITTKLYFSLFNGVAAGI